jgi:hypothetical protein
MTGNFHFQHFSCKSKLCPKCESGITNLQVKHLHRFICSVPLAVSSVQSILHLNCARWRNWGTSSFDLLHRVNEAC